MPFFKHTEPAAEPAPPVEPAEQTVPETHPEPSAEPVEATLPVPAAPNWNTSEKVMSYPLVKETVDLVMSIPGVQSLEDTKNAFLEPAISYVHSQVILKPVIKNMDNMGTLTLNAVENTIPALKTATFATVSDLVKSPFIQMEQSKLQAMQWTEETVDRTFFSPARKMIHDTRVYYNNHWYDTRGKPLLRSSLDPVMRPVNQFLEDFALKNFPEPAIPFSSDSSTEIGKSIQLSKDVTMRALPVIMKKKTDVAMMPYNCSLHVINVFRENMDKRSGWTAPIMVPYASSVALVSEAWSTTAKAIGLEKSPAMAEDIMKAAAEAVPETVQEAVAA